MYADNQTTAADGVKIVFSGPVDRTTDGKQKCVMTAVSRGDDTFVHSSDVRGLCSPDAAGFILQQRPQVLYLDGPDAEARAGGEAVLQRPDCLERIQQVLESTPVTTLILDHHIMRERGGLRLLEPLFSLALKKGITVRTAAGTRGEENNLLEARRRVLYACDPSEEEPDA